jgi:uncharacterized protein (DUF2249 family)
MAMTMDLDLRDCSEEHLREKLFEVLEESEISDELNIIADRDIDPDLVRYQVEHNRTVDWEYADPDAEPRKLHLTVGSSFDTDNLATIDVRDLKPQRRHEVLLTIFDGLGAGEGFVLVNDHDPKPLYHEFRSIHGDIVEWEYANRGSGEWRVEVVKTDDSKADTDDVVTRYDVRQIPKQERHPTIHHRYGMIPEGGTMELIAPHEPRPLRQEFRQQYGDSFTWTVIESKRGRCRVWITKEGSADEEEAEASSAPSKEEAKSAAVNRKPEIIDELDVRDLPPAQRHEQIFEAYAELQTGEAFVLVNDHDPKPLYHQFDAEEGPEFYWAYRQRESNEFRVLIGKTEVNSSTGGSVERSDAPF